MSRRPGTLVLLATAGLLLAACDDPTPPQPTSTTAAPSAAEEPSSPTAGATPTPAPLIPEDVIEGLDAAVAAESDPVASTSAQTDGLPSGATLEVLQLERTGTSGYLLRVRLSWAEEMSLSADQHRSLSLDGDHTFVDALRLVDEEAERFVLPTVYQPQDSEQVDDTERYRCLCSTLVARIPATGQILSARYGPLGGETEPEALTLEVPGFEPITQIPVTEG